MSAIAPPVGALDDRADRLPRWATAADLAAIFVMVVATAVIVGDGFRLWIGDLRISVTSPVRPIVVGAALLLVRHALVRRPTILHRIRVRLRALTSSDGWRSAWKPFVATRAGVFLAGLMAVYTIGIPVDAGRTRIANSEAVNLAMRWDAGWYLHIARVGYRWDPARESEKQNIAFFPFFPMTLYVVGRLFGGEGSAFALSGTVISHVAFLWSLILLYHLARRELGDESSAAATVLLLACYPFSIFHGAVYTESIFLLSAVGAILEFRRERWGRASAWGFIAGLTRPNGFLLAATLAAMALTADVWRRRAFARESVLPLAAVAAPVAGMLLFAIYIWLLTGDPLQAWEQHAAWGRRFESFAPQIEAAKNVVAQRGIEAYLAAAPYKVLNGLAALFALVLIVPIGLRLGLPYAVFLFSNVVPPLVIGGTMSMGRLTATMFPLFMWLAVARRQWTVPLAVAFALWQGLAAVLFYTWRPLY